MKEVDIMTKTVAIDTEMITLGQFLKLADVIQSGGMAKWFYRNMKYSSMTSRITAADENCMSEMW